MTHDAKILTGGRNIGFSKAVLDRSPEMRAYLGLGPVEAKKPKPTASQALVRSDEKQQGGKKFMVVSLVQFRKSLLDDHDNARAACKPIVDAIAASLGVDDGDRRIKWQYGQIETRGEQGVMLKIELI